MRRKSATIWNAAGLTAERKKHLCTPGYRGVFLSAVFSLPACIIGVIAAAADFFLIVWLSGLVTLSAAVWIRFVVLRGGSMINLLALFVLYSTCAEGEIIYAGVKG